MLIATVGTGTALGAADSAAVNQQPEPTNNSSNESLTDPVTTNSSTVSTVSARDNTTSNGSEVEATSTSTARGNESANSAPSESVSASELRFTFPSQTTNGMSVTVREPRLPEGGFLVVHSQSYPQNGLGSVIGVSEYIRPNTSYSRVQVRLFDVAGRSFDRSRLRASSTIYVQAVLDTNNNQQYDALATNGAQDVGYLVDGSRPAVARARIGVKQTRTTESQSGGFVDAFGSGQNRTTTSTSNGAETGTPRDGLRLNPDRGDGFTLESIPNFIDDFGPLLVVLAGLAVGLYIKNK